MKHEIKLPISLRVHCQVLVQIRTQNIGGMSFEKIKIVESQSSEKRKVEISKVFRLLFNRV